jgi:hypothetical protein
VKVTPTKSAPDKKPSIVQQEDSESKLEIQGFTNQGEALFKYTNKAQGIEQAFGVMTKQYQGHM